MGATAGNDPSTGKRRFFADLSVNTKILTAITIAVLVALTVGVAGLRALSGASASAQQIYSSNVTNVGAVGIIKAVMTQARVDLANQAISTSDANMAKYTKGFAADLEAAAAAMTAYGANRPAGDPAVLAGLRTNWQAYVEVAQNKQLPAGLANDLTSWQNTRDTVITPIFKKINQGLADLEAAESADAATSAASAKSGYRSSRTASILMLIIGCLLAFGLGLAVARQIVGSLTKVSDICNGLAAGDLTRTSGLTTRDEPGQMGRSLDTAIARIRETVSTIDGSATSLASASEEMSGIATQIAATAAQTTSQAQSVSAAAEQVSRSVDTVIAGSEEMGASIREISENASQAAQVAAEAVRMAASTSTTMSKLGESSTEIGNVIKVITAIAEQTNLLALNATIEAARAGEMGKGFAVVASEVKDLAQETARATEDIARRVEAIQGDTTGAVTAIEEISKVIARISDFQTTIASAVEEQTATTGEMNRSVSEAATGSSDIAENITAVAEAARRTSEGVSQTQQATAEMARMSADLTALVGTFRY
jgi:methyl-accepting chemotaxis protein